MGEPELNDIWAESVIKLQAENAQLKARLAYQDKWLSNGIYYAHIEPGTTLYTDEHAGYNALRGLFFGHETVNHSAKEYVRGTVSTNSIESVWAVLKRGIHGVYHHASEKHLGRYVNEFTFRLNDGNVKRHTLERLDSFVAVTANKRLTYKELTA